MIEDKLPVGEQLPLLKTTEGVKWDETKEGDSEGDGDGDDMSKNGERRPKGEGVSKNGEAGEDEAERGSPGLYAGGGGGGFISGFGLMISGFISSCLVEVVPLIDVTSRSVDSKRSPGARCGWGLYS